MAIKVVQPKYGERTEYVAIGQSFPSATQFVATAPSIGQLEKQLESFPKGEYIIAAKVKRVVVE